MGPSDNASCDHAKHRTPTAQQQQANRINFSCPRIATTPVPKGTAQIPRRQALRGDTDGIANPKPIEPQASNHQQTLDCRARVIRSSPASQAK